MRSSRIAIYNIPPTIPKTPNATPLPSGEPKLEKLQRRNTAPVSPPATTANPNRAKENRLVFELLISGEGVAAEYGLFELIVTHRPILWFLSV